MSTYWVKLRRWDDAVRAFEYRLVEMPGTRGAIAAGVECEHKNQGWRYVEVWSIKP